MTEMDFRSYIVDRDQALREEIMNCSDKMFMASGVRRCFAQEHESLMAKLFGHIARI